MEKKKYSMASHLIHSRLQLIKGRLRYDRYSHPANILPSNKKFFDKAAEAVKRDDGIECEWKDQFDAAELLYYSEFPQKPKDAIEYYVVQFQNLYGVWLDIQSYDSEKGFVLADPNERMTHQQALDRINTIAVGRSVVFRTMPKWAYK